MLKPEDFNKAPPSFNFSDPNSVFSASQEPTLALQCPSCTLSFDRTSLLQDHMTSVHKTFPSVWIKAEPINITTQEGLFCPKCKNSFAHKYSLMKHLRSTRCKIPDEVSINRVINNQLTCSSCRHQFGSVQALNKHVMAQKCSLSSDEPIDKSNTAFKGSLVFDDAIQLTPNATVSVFKCPDLNCSKPCVTLRAFRMHAKCMHKENSDLDPILEEVKANFICKVRGCGKLFVEENQLDVHFKHHENYTPRAGKHKCHLCKEAFFQRDMLKRHVLSFHNEVTSFRSRLKVPKSSNKLTTAAAPSGGYKRTLDNPNPLKYNPNVYLTPGTMMTVFKCPVLECGKNSCTDLKSFKLHCLHIHQSKELLPIVTQEEAKYICTVESCGKLYMEKKQYEIHQRHHKTYVPSSGRYFPCQNCDRKFNSQANLDVHTLQVHLNAEDSASSKSTLLFEDITLAPGTMMSVFHCPAQGCSKRNYLDVKSVKTHYRRFHSMPPKTPIEFSPCQVEAQFICQVRGCRKLFVETIQIEAHLKHHRNYVPTNGHFECKCCSQVFTRKLELDQHTLNCHTYNGIMQEKIHEVRHTVHGSLLAPTQTNFQSSLSSNSANVLTVEGYQCSICMRKFLHLGTHRNHVTNAHQMPALGPVKVEVKPRYSCKHPGCGKHFMTRAMHRVHIERHKSKEIPVGSSKSSKKVLKCPKCPGRRPFAQFKSLYQHLLQTHADVSPEEMAELESAYVKCHICLNMFRSEDILKNHMKKHQVL